MPQTLFEFGGTGPALHVAVANGFPPETYIPLVAPLTERFRVVSLPPRALWDDPPAVNTVKTWRDLAVDLLNGLQQHQLDNVVAVGHSFGAIASLVAAAEAPERFRALVLLDPTIFPQRILTLISLMRSLGMASRMPLVGGALKRRAQFESPEQAFEYWRGKRLFRDWTDETLWLYTRSMLRPSAAGGLVLTWSPPWEARYYQTILTTTWRYLRRLPPALPLLIVRGERSDTFSPETAKRVRELLPHAEYAEVQANGHLFPQSAPAQTAAILQPWLMALS